ncbi:MAG: hypothetical protein PHC66_04875 [Candidatus Nanoarchaeia archaeon]|nr:hypothetical protein [Candidatus Nanoarchaeia archaeon]MDD5239822.1 hypothetical protein [Candidatus Nanoarchaeia archaeon]
MTKQKRKSETIQASKAASISKSRHALIQKDNDTKSALYIAKQDNYNRNDEIDALINMFRGSDFNDYHTSLVLKALGIGVGMGFLTATSYALFENEHNSDKDVDGFKAKDIWSYEREMVKQVPVIQNNASAVWENETTTYTFDDLATLACTASLTNDLNITSIIDLNTNTTILGGTDTFGGTDYYSTLTEIVNTSNTQQLINNITSKANVDSWINQSLNNTATYQDQKFFDLSRDFDGDIDVSNVTLNFTKVYAKSDIMNNASAYNLVRNNFINRIVHTNDATNITMHNENNSSLTFELRDVTADGFEDNTTFAGRVTNGQGSGYTNITDATGDFNGHLDNAHVTNSTITLSASEFRKLLENGDINGTGTIEYGNGNVSFTQRNTVNWDDILNNTAEITLRVSDANITADLDCQISNFTARGDMDIIDLSADVGGLVAGHGFNATLSGSMVSSEINLWYNGQLDSQHMSNDFKLFMLDVMDSYMRMGLAGDAYFQGIPTMNYHLKDGMWNNNTYTLNDVLTSSTNYKQELVHQLNQTLYSTLNGQSTGTAVKDDRIEYALQLGVDAALRLGVQLNEKKDAKTNTTAYFTNAAVNNHVFQVTTQKRIGVPGTVTVDQYVPLGVQPTGIVGIITGATTALLSGIAIDAYRVGGKKRRLANTFNQAENQIYKGTTIRYEDDETNQKLNQIIQKQDEIIASNDVPPELYTQMIKEPVEWKSKFKQ